MPQEPQERWQTRRLEQLYYDDEKTCRLNNSSRVVEMSCIQGIRDSCRETGDSSRRTSGRAHAIRTDRPHACEHDMHQTKKDRHKEHTTTTLDSVRDSGDNDNSIENDDYNAMQACTRTRSMSLDVF